MLGARIAAKEVCIMNALPYITTTQLQSHATMAQKERAANQGPQKVHLENYVFVKIIPHFLEKLFQNNFT